jgi:hypothetical protein
MLTCDWIDGALLRARHPERIGLEHHLLIMLMRMRTGCGRLAGHRSVRHDASDAQRTGEQFCVDAAPDLFQPHLPEEAAAGQSLVIVASPSRSLGGRASFQ